MSQIEKWGDSDLENASPYKLLAILVEEVGEIAHALLEHDEDNLDEEIVQVAAVATKWIEHRKLLKSRARKEDPTYISSTLCGND